MSELDTVIEAAEYRLRQLIVEAGEYEKLGQDKLVKEYLGEHIKPLKLAIQSVKRDRLRVNEADSVLAAVDDLLTTVRGDNVPRGDAPKLQVRGMVRSYMQKHGVKPIRSRRRG